MRRKKRGFTMVELLVVLLIIGILAAVAVPLYLANARRSRASEAVGTMSLIRQSMRDWFTSHSAYYDIAYGDIENQYPPAAGSPGVGIDMNVVQYFSEHCYSVDATTPGGTATALGADFTVGGTQPNAQDFLVIARGLLVANGGTNVDCVAGGATADCAVNGDEVDDYMLLMDNSGRTFVSYNANVAAPDWSAW